MDAVRRVPGAPIALPDRSSAGELERALAPVTIATAELIGTFER